MGWGVVGVPGTAVEQEINIRVNSQRQAGRERKASSGVGVDKGSPVLAVYYAGHPTLCQSLAHLILTGTPKSNRNCHHSHIHTGY